MLTERHPKLGGMTNSAEVRTSPLYDAFGVPVSNSQGEVVPPQSSPEDITLTQDKALLSQLAAYVKYLYEEENNRRDVLNKTTKLFLGGFAVVVSIGFTRLSAIEALPTTVARLTRIVPGGTYLALFAGTLLLAVAALFCASFIFTVLVLKMWKWERLCDPQQFVFRAMTMSSHSRLLSAIVADYVVAGNRNHKINEQKARLLSKALISFISSFVMFVSAWAVLHVVEVAWR